MLQLSHFVLVWVELSIDISYLELQIDIAAKAFGDVNGSNQESLEPELVRIQWSMSGVARAA